MVFGTNKKHSSENDTVTFIGEDAAFEGDLRFSGTLQIDGNYKGTISGHGTIIIGKQGIVEGGIHVPSVIIHGEVHGDVTAESRIDLRESASVLGDIQAPSIRIDPGATLQGRCKTHQVENVDDEREATISSVKPTKMKSAAS